MESRVGMWPRVTTFSAGFALLAITALADGGFFRETWVWISLALSSLTCIVLALRERIVIGRLDLVALAALVSLAGWVALSAVWSPTPEATTEEAERALIYVAGFLAVVLLVERDRAREHFAGIAAAAVLVVAYGVGERLLEQPEERDPTQGTLLNEPFGYANALGIFGTVGLLVSLGLAVTARSRVARISWIAAALALIPAVVWTDSRGSWFALIVGLCVLAAFEWNRTLALAPGLPKGAVPAVLVVAVVVAVAVAIVRADGALGPRVDYWDVALRQWQENPWLGSGAGTFALYWLREEASDAVLDAHNLYLETLAEVGPVGLALLIVALGVPAFAAIRARDRPLVGVGAAAYSAYLVHAGLDWDWEMPAVTLAGLLCGVGILAAGRREADEITVGGRARAGFALAALAIAALAVAAGLTH